MEGVALASYVTSLKKVPAHRNRKPVASYDLRAALGEGAVRYLATYGHEENELESTARSLPLRFLTPMGIDRMHKLRMSSIFMMESDFEDLMRSDPEHTLIRKIESSMWRWGFRRAGWNELVDAHNSIRTFDLGLPDFEVRLDHTTGYNEIGYSEHSRTFLDGVFAYLVYYRGEHVMTLGFSISDRHRLLIQQVQLQKRRGNRFLFRLPKNYMEHIISRFEASFPRYKLFIADGGEIANRSLRSYQNGLEKAQAGLKRLTSRRDQGEVLSRWDEKDIDYHGMQVDEFSAKVGHLVPEVERIAGFYADCGRYNRGEKLKANGMTHYRLELSN